MKRETTFSPCRKYRYTLWREWGIDLLTDCTGDAKGTNSYVMFIGLNPSTADETNDDPTIRKCVGYAQRWGYGALCMTNLFALRATDPRVMKMAHEPIGEDNPLTILRVALNADMIICAWGRDGAYLNRGDRVITNLRDNGIKKMHHLGLNSDGTPKHPLYLKSRLEPIPLL